MWWESKHVQESLPIPLQEFMHVTIVTVSNSTVLPSYYPDKQSVFHCAAVSKSKTSHVQLATLEQNIRVSYSVALSLKRVFCF